MSRRIMAALAAGAILVGAGFVYSIVSNPSVASAQEDSGEDEATPRPLRFLQRILDELVEEGTIEEEDAEAVMTAVEEEIEEFREEHPNFHPRQHHLHKGARLGALLDDGGISQEEYDALPEDSRLRRLDLEDALADGLITSEELREAWQAHHEG